MSALGRLDYEPRKCRNCRFYRDANFAASGWCTHPERGEFFNLVMVRGAELACRNRDDQDRWEAGAPYLAMLVVHEYVQGVQ